MSELALGGELFDRICRKGSYHESDARELVKVILSVAEFLHDHGIVHRSLKPENMLFRTPDDNSDLLITGFGLSKITDDEYADQCNSVCGTPSYMAPEIFKGNNYGKPV